jgi:DNA-directed RNA polymerase specialized sigma24 family protein
LAGPRWRHRRVLELKLAGYREIMELLGVTYTNVNRQLSEGRAQLRWAA